MAYRSRLLIFYLFVFVNKFQYCFSRLIKMRGIIQIFFIVMNINLFIIKLRKLFLHFKKLIADTCVVSQTKQRIILAYWRCIAYTILKALSVPMDEAQIFFFPHNLYVSIDIWKWNFPSHYEHNCQVSPWVGITFYQLVFLIIDIMKNFV